jgi:hypothetical protein
MKTIQALAHRRLIAAFDVPDVGSRPDMEKVIADKLRSDTELVLWTLSLQAACGGHVDGFN